MLLKDLEKLSWQNLPCNWPSSKCAMKKISKTWYFQLHIDIDEYISLLVTFQLSSKPLSCCYFRLTNLWHVAAYFSCPGIIQTPSEFVGRTCWGKKHWNVQIYHLIFFFFFLNKSQTFARQASSVRGNLDHISWPNRYVF